MSEDPLAASLDLLRRLPPQNIPHNLSLLQTLLPEELAEELVGAVDQPMGTKVDAGGREYLTCDYNRDGDSYRSPWTNEYDPPLADGTTPSPSLRPLEMAMNEGFDVYRDLYYEGGISSVYLWDVDGGFAGVVLLKKGNNSTGTEASWDSVHVFEASERGRTASYKLTSTVMMYMSRSLSSPASSVSLGGSITRQASNEAPFDPSTAANGISSHIENVGKMIEEMEMKVRNTLQEVYFSKTREVVNTLRSSAGLSEEGRKRALQGELVGLLGRKSATA